MNRMCCIRPNVVETFTRCGTNEMLFIAGLVRALTLILSIVGFHACQKMLVWVVAYLMLWCVVVYQMATCSFAHSWKMIYMPG